MSEFKTPKWPKPFKEFSVPLYGGRVYIFDNKDKARQAHEYLTKKPTEAMTGAGRTTQFDNSDNGAVSYVICVFDGKTCTLVHELAHLTFFILDRAGVPVDVGANNEAYCYLLDTLFEESCK